MDANLYLYAVMEAGEVPELGDIPGVGLPEGGLESQVFGDLAVVTSQTGEDEIMSTRRNMLAHTKVLETVMAGRPILPFSFGTIVRDRESIAKIVDGQSDKLVADLASLRDHMEVGVRVSWDEGRIFNEIVEEHDALRKLAAQIRSRPANETYYDRIEIGKQVEEIMRRKRSVEAERIAKIFESFAARDVIREPGADMVVFDAAYLIKSRDEPEMYAALEAHEQANPDRLNIKYLAPVPPYNFVSIKIETEQSEAA